MGRRRKDEALGPTRSMGVHLKECQHKELGEVSKILTAYAGRQISKADVVRVGVETAMEMSAKEILERL